MDFWKRELKKSEEKSSKEKAFAFSFEKIEEELNSWIQRDKYSNKIINDLINNLSKCSELKKDNFLQIVTYTLNSLEKIVDNPKKNLITISELQEINKITTTNFKTMVWLGSKPGRTLAEKVGVKGKVLAPKNIYSIDKKENRIVNYYVKKVLEILEIRFLIYKNSDIKSDVFQEIYNKFYRIKRKMILNEMFFLRRPLDFIPNNTLIDHRDYSVVNRGLNLLKKYIKESNYQENDIIEKSTLLIFINIINSLNILSNYKVVKKIFDIKSLITSGEDVVEYFIENKKIYYLKIEIKNKKIKISLCDLFFNEKNKKIQKNKILLAEEFELILSKKYDCEKNLLKFSISSSSLEPSEEMILNDEDLNNIAKKNVEKIIKIVGNVENNENSNDLVTPLEENEKGVYISLNTPLSFLNKRILEDTAYSKNIFSFIDLKDYFSISESEEIIPLSDNFCKGENLERISKYLEKLNIESKTGIYSSPEFQDSDVQKDIYTIFNSNLKKSYPVWRSILAAYTLDDEIEEKQESIVLDLNAINPSLNIIKKYDNTFEHHPVLIKYMDNLENFSLDNFIKYYLEKYLSKYSIKISKKEKLNLLSSRKLNSILFLNKEKIIINKKQDSFYLDKDLEILENLIFKLSQEFFEILKDNIRKLNLFNIKIIIISDYLSLTSKILKEKLDIRILKEKELGLSKNKILEKIILKKIVWNEFLPNLTLETLKEGHFYNLSLIKDKSINLTLGEEVVFEVEDTLIFPPGIKTIKFPLYSEDSLDKKIYFLEVKSQSFPLKDPLEVKFEIGYSYGNKNPYRIIIVSNNKQIEFETKWIEQTEEIQIKQINFPEVIVDEDQGQNILNYILILKNNYLKLEEHLRKSKNKFRKYLIYKVENNCKEEIINHPSINFLISLLEKLEQTNDLQESDEKLMYAIKLFLASFNNLLILNFKTTREKDQIEKRKFLFNYQYGDTKLITWLNEKNSIINVLSVIETISELSWLDKSFINGVATREPKVLNRCLTQVIETLKYTRENFDKEYKKVSDRNKIWEMTNRIRNCFEFLLALFLLEKEKNILFNKMKNKKEYYELLYNIKEIDRKIQMDIGKYPGLKENFNEGMRIKISIEEKENLEEVSDLVYSLYTYMTGSDGSNLIRVKEVVED